jgi:hypothetical protein
MARDRHEGSDEVLRLLVGAVFLAGKEVKHRAKAASTAALDGALPADSSPLGLRSLAVGAIFSVARLLRMAGHDAAGMAGRVLRRMPRLTAALEALAEEGRAEEQRSMRLAELTLRVATDEVTRALADSAEIREVVLEQGASLTEATAKTLRKSAESADDLVDRLLHLLVRRRRRPEEHPDEDAR